MRKFIGLLLLLGLLVASVHADARGGRGDECPPGSTDPDCADSKPGK